MTDTEAITTMVCIDRDGTIRRRTGTCWSDEHWMDDDEFQRLIETIPAVVAGELDGDDD